MPVGNKIGFDWIVERVPNCAPVLDTVADGMIVAFVLPKWAIATEQLVGAGGRVRLELLEDSVKGFVLFRTRRQRFADNVKMVGHNAEGIQPEGAAVAMMKRFGNQRRDACIPQPHRAGRSVV